jgi:hypothetical protein
VTRFGSHRQVSWIGRTGAEIPTGGTPFYLPVISGDRRVE